MRPDFSVYMKWFMEHVATIPPDLLCLEDEVLDGAVFCVKKWNEVGGVR